MLHPLYSQRRRVYRHPFSCIVVFIAAERLDQRAAVSAIDVLRSITRVHNLIYYCVEMSVQIVCNAQTMNLNCIFQIHETM